MISTILGLAIALGCAYGCYVLAQKSNYNPIIAAVVGFFFPLIGLIIYYLLSQRKG